MKFVIYINLGSGVAYKSFFGGPRSVYTGAAPEKGVWHIDVKKLESILAAEFASLSFGVSIDEFVFGFEMADAKTSGEWFAKSRGYVSYRPQRKQVVSVGQVEWKRVKDLSLEQQWPFLVAALMNAIDRLRTAKRKPKDFDAVALAAATSAALSRCSAAMVAA